MRIYLIINAIGMFLLALGLLLLIPLIVALIYQEHQAVLAFGIAAITGIIAGYICRKFETKYHEPNRAEGIVIVAFSWLIASLLGAIPYLFFNLNLVDSIFESMSGFTTTGATIFKDFSLYPRALFFWRSFTQWLGGMGIIVLFIAILPQFAIGGRQLFFAEAPGPTEDQLTPRIRHTAKNLWALYFVLTAIEVILLSIFGMPIFDSICNSLSTLAAGGFSPHPQSIMGYGNPVFEWIIIVFMFLAGANFALQFRVVRSRDPGRLIKNEEFMIYSLIFAGSTVLLAMILLLFDNVLSLNALRLAAFQAISIITTTGFSNIDFALWSDQAKIILVSLMFIGGCAGSSGGGIKVVRILLLVKNSFNEILQTLHPRAVLPLKLDTQIVSNEVMRQISVFFVFYLVILLISTIFVSFLEGDMLVGFTSAAATLGNIGPGLGVIGPLGTYGNMTEVSKIILIINMWVGRLEIMTVLILLSPITWKYVSRK